jgi:hypothetical protein
MVRIVPEPPALIRMATQADAEKTGVTLTADEVRDIAQMWHEDRTRVRYLEALIVKIARGTDGKMTPCMDPAQSRPSLPPL